MKQNAIEVFANMVVDRAYRSEDIKVLMDCERSLNELLPRFHDLEDELATRIILDIEFIRYKMKRILKDD